MVETNPGKVLLIGVTGGTGGNVIKGFLEQGITNLRVITRKIDLNRPVLSKINNAGIELVEANFDDANSLITAFTDIDGVYCHALAADSVKPDPWEVTRGKTIAQLAKQHNIQHFVYNSAGGAERKTGIKRIEQKYQVEQILQAAGLGTTMLRACLFMEEFWKKYTRPAILKGKFPFSIPSDRPLHLIANRDMGRIAAYVFKNYSQYIGREIELAGDVLTPQQIAQAFSQAQGLNVVHQEVPAWLFLLLWQKELFDLIQWYRHAGYQADVQHLRSEEFPGLLTTFTQFLAQTNWGDRGLSYETLSHFDL